MRFATTLLHHGPIILLLSGLMTAWGLYAWTELPIDAFPDVTNNQVMILSKAPGLAAADVEQRVSFPLERAMRGLPRVKQVRSLSKAELSQVVIVFDDDAEIYWTRQVVFERLASAKQDLPPGVEPQLGPISTGLGEILQYTLESDQASSMELRTVQDWIVAPLLAPIEGINEINSFGGEVKQYQVIVSQDKLLAHGLTISTVVEALERDNTNAAGGVIVSGWEQVYLRGVGLLKDIPDIESVVLSAKDGSVVYLRDVAQVVIDAAPRQGAVTRDGKGEVVAGMIIMLRGENSRDVVSRSKQAIERIRPTLPEGVRLNVFYDRTSLIDACIDTVVHALLEGGLLVIVVLFLFVAELRTSLIVVLSLPLTFLASFIVMGWAGLSSNLMSLGGLAFSVGMVVDASIVVVENARRGLASVTAKEDRLRAVAQSLAEVARPVGFSVLIIAIILVPLFTLQGIEGKMFAPLAGTMLIALLVSLVVALTIVPVLSARFLPTGVERQFGFSKRLHSGYLALLQKCTNRPKTTLVVVALVVIGSATLVPFVGTEFMPPLDEGAIAINVVRLPNASLVGSVQVATAIEQQLGQYQEVQAVVSKTGRAEISEDPMGPEQTDVLIMLRPRGQWTSGRSKAELVEAMQKDIGKIPGLRLSFSQPIALRVNELVSGVKSDLAVKVFGPDMAVLSSFAQRAAAVLGSVEGAQDVKVEQVSGMEQLDAIIDREAAARHGINAGDINATIEAAVAGREVTTLIEEERRSAVVVRFAQDTRKDIRSLEQLLVPAPGGERVPLGELANLQLVEGLAQVSRENGMRRVVAEANVRGRDLGSFVTQVQARLEPLVKALPSGYYVEYGGQFENQQRAMRQLAIVVPVAILLIVLLLYFALGSLLDCALVLVNLPLALVGGVIAVVMFDMPLSVSAAVAFIVLLGIAVQNAVVLVAFFRQLLGQGFSVAQAIQRGCDIRFRPLLMTALTSFIGHLPMLYATGSGADIQKPLAVVVMGGIITSSLLTLLVLPVIYGMAHQRRSGLQ